MWLAITFRLARYKAIGYRLHFWKFQIRKIGYNFFFFGMEWISSLFLTAMVREAKHPYSTHA